MRTFAIGDVQGCYDELRLLIDKLNPTDDDRLWFVGDLVNRGPKSLKTLRYIRNLGKQAVCVLGNHDLHLLALSINHKTPVNAAWLAPVLQAKDSDELLDWLMHRPLAHFDAKLNTLMVHAGVPPDWSVIQTLKHAAEVEAVLRGNQAKGFFRHMYGGRPKRWKEDLTGFDRLRFITNCLTRMRYCTRSGELNFRRKSAPGRQPKNLLPWFDVKNRLTADTRIVFGHWSTLGLVMRPNIIATDTGCVWGRKLTAVRLDKDSDPVQVKSLQR